ncbi:hypothetical protein SAMN05216474_3124 [Lishizhenia tianjinensis]|uniref:Uncharacterized protein n=1 Tax=Lishizhenia tianjinensis TaxID=477690 RepID=A0A1I7BVR0_9FLAO|nr:hypothetical protein [Lishizhenia tianjinensis]SFT91296.1 hypothetical protein SAMN05216474_3124 [Lishizhenia tianjinensis]
MKKTVLGLLIFISSLSQAQLQILNHKQEALNNVEVLKHGELVGISNDEGRLPALEKDTTYTLFHPSYRLKEFVYNKQENLNLGEPIQLFESVGVSQNEGNLFQRIYDSTYHNFVKQNIAVLGELWIYQRVVATSSEKNDTTLNIIKADVAYAKHEKRKKETWWVKGEPQRMFQRGGVLFGEKEFKKESLNLNGALPSPDYLTSFFRYKSFFESSSGYDQERYYSPTLSRVNLKYSNEKNYLLSHDIQYASLNYSCEKYESIRNSPERIATVMNIEMFIPKKYNYWKFVEKEGHYYPEMMRFGYHLHTSRTDIIYSGDFETCYIFKAKEVVPQNELSEEYKKENFSNNNFIQRIKPTPEILNFPYVME